jgi:hypothetical protein
MKSTSASVKILFVVILCWIWREYSWYSHSIRLEESFKEIKEVLSTVYGYIQAPIEECVSEKSSAECTVGYADKGKIITSITTFLQKVPYVIEQFKLTLETMAPIYLFKSYGIDMIIITMMICLQQYELYAYTNHTNKYNRYSINTNTTKVDISKKYLSRHLHILHSRGYPASNMLFFIIIFVISCSAWLGSWISNSLNRSKLIYDLIRLCIFWLISLILSSCIDNFRLMWKYLPNTFQEFKEKMTNIKSENSKSWWFWILPRLFMFGPGLDNLSLGFTGAYYILFILFLWPLRYYYFNLITSCSDNGSNSVQPTEIFICRMLIHFSFLASWYSYTTCSVLGFPFAFNATKIEFSAHFTTVCALVNSVLCLLSVLWFALFSGGCGWWASIVAFGFLNPHIIAAITNAMIVTASIHRQHEFWLNVRASFIESYTQYRLSKYFSNEINKPLEESNPISDKNKENEKKKGEAENKDEGAIDADKKNRNERVNKLIELDAKRQLFINSLDLEGDLIFDQLLDSACMIYLWLPIEKNEHVQPDENNKKDHGSFVFQCAVEDWLRQFISRKQYSTAS